MGSKKFPSSWDYSISSPSENGQEGQREAAASGEVSQDKAIDLSVGGSKKVLEKIQEMEMPGSGFEVNSTGSQKLSKEVGDFPGVFEQLKEKHGEYVTIPNVFGSVLDESSKAEQEVVVAVPLPLEKSWVHGSMQGEKGIISMQNFLLNWEEELLSSHCKVYNIQRLPLPVAYRNMKAGTCGVCHVVRIKSPWDFHVIFSGHRVLDYMPNNAVWKNYFKDLVDEDKRKYQFQSALQTFHGLSTLLTEFLTHLATRGSQGFVPFNDFKFDAGDLVIVKIARRNGSHVAYRGVVVERLFAITVSQLDYKEECFRVYLLDSGETFLAPKITLTPLPHIMCGFPPMAVKCALHGISPVGPTWSSYATKLMTDNVQPKAGARLFAEFFDRNMMSCRREKQQQPCTSLSALLSDLVTPQPIFVELRHVENVNQVLSHGTQPTSVAVNISSLLIQNYVALQWALYPPRPQLGKHTLEGEDPRQKTPGTSQFHGLSPSISRESALVYCKMGQSQRVPFAHMEQIFLEGLRLCCVNREMEPLMIEGESNKVAFQFQDPDGRLQKEAISPFFKSD